MTTAMLSNAELNQQLEDERKWKEPAERFASALLWAEHFAAKGDLKRAAVTLQAWKDEARRFLLGNEASHYAVQGLPDREP